MLIGDSVTCPDCLFTYSGKHFRGDGTDTCPACEETRLQAALERAEATTAAVVRAAEDRLREAAELTILRAEYGETPYQTPFVRLLTRGGGEETLFPGDSWRLSFNALPHASLYGTFRVLYAHRLEPALREVTRLLHLVLEGRKLPPSAERWVREAEEALEGTTEPLAVIPPGATATEDHRNMTDHVTELTNVHNRMRVAAAAFAEDALPAAGGVFFRAEAWRWFLKELKLGKPETGAPPDLRLVSLSAEDAAELRSMATWLRDHHGAGGKDHDVWSRILSALSAAETPAGIRQPGLTP